MVAAVLDAGKDGRRGVLAKLLLEEGGGRREERVVAVEEDDGLVGRQRAERVAEQLPAPDKAAPRLAEAEDVEVVAKELGRGAERVEEALVVCGDGEGVHRRHAAREVTER